MSIAITLVTGLALVAFITHVVRTEMSDRREHKYFMSELAKTRL